MRFGIQLYPHRTAPEMAAYAYRAMTQHAFDKVWAPDHLTYENVFVILAAIVQQTNAHDGAAAKRCAKPMAAGALIQGHMLKQCMLKPPVPEEITKAIETAHNAGRSVDDMIDLISDELLTEIGTVIAGTPVEVIAGIDVMLRAANPYGFDSVDIASLLGPDWHEAIDLICQEVIPEIERRAKNY